MSVQDPTRARWMGERVVRTARDAGAEQELLDELAELHRIASLPRLARLDDDHDPRLLHPGRSALVLLLDAGCLDREALAVALVHDGSGPELEPAADRLPAPLAGLRAGLPRAGDLDLIERLLELDPPIQAALIAERLDHLRHLHLGPLDDAARSEWREARDVWAPFAARVNATLSRRLAWWVGKFEGRYGR